MTVNAIDLDAITEALSRKADIDLVNCTQDQMTTVSKEYFAGLSLPSTRFVNLTLGTSGNTYTAPANGWVAIYGEFNSTEIYNNSKCNLYWGIVGPNSAWKGVSCPVAKGDIFRVYWSSYGTSLNFRFIYAEGVK